MTIKAKLFTAILTFLLVLALLLTGVWAAKSATINLGGSVSFVANNVYCQVSGVYDGFDENSGVENPTTLVWDSNANADGTPSEEALNTWTGQTLAFNENADDISLTITFTNLSKEVGIDIKLTQTLSFSGYGVAYQLDGANYTLGNTKSLDPLSSCEFVITFSIDSDEYSIASEPYEYLFNLDSQVA